VRSLEEKDIMTGQLEILDRLHLETVRREGEGGERFLQIWNIPLNPFWNHRFTNLMLRRTVGSIRVYVDQDLDFNRALGLRSRSFFGAEPERGWRELHIGLSPDSSDDAVMLLLLAFFSNPFVYEEVERLSADPGLLMSSPGAGGSPSETRLAEPAGNAGADQSGPAVTPPDDDAGGGNAAPSDPLRAGGDRDRNGNSVESPLRDLRVERVRDGGTVRFTYTYGGRGAVVRECLRDRASGEIVAAEVREIRSGPQRGEIALELPVGGGGGDVRSVWKGWDGVVLQITVREDGREFSIERALKDGGDDE
jgi:hypothetical protein